MKSSKRKNATKSKTVETKPTCCTHMVFRAIIGTVWAIFLIVLVGHSLSGPKFEVGDCLLNRVGETLEVKDVDTVLTPNTYTLAPQQYVESYNGFVAIRNYDRYTQEKEIEFVDEKYIKVPCSR